MLNKEPLQDHNKCRLRRHSEKYRKERNPLNWTHSNVVHKRFQSAGFTTLNNPLQVGQ